MGLQSYKIQIAAIEACESLLLVGDQVDVQNRYESAEGLFAAGGFDFVDIATTVDSHIELVKLAATHKNPNNLS